MHFLLLGVILVKWIMSASRSSLQDVQYVIWRMHELLWRVFLDASVGKMCASALN